VSRFCLIIYLLERKASVNRSLHFLVQCNGFFDEVFRSGIIYRWEDGLLKSPCPWGWASHAAECFCHRRCSGHLRHRLHLHLLLQCSSPHGYVNGKENKRVDLMNSLPRVNYALFHKNRSLHEHRFRAWLRSINQRISRSISLAFKIFRCGKVRPEVSEVFSIFLSM